MMTRFDCGVKAKMTGIPSLYCKATSQPCGVLRSTETAHVWLRAATTARSVYGNSMFRSGDGPRMP